MCLCFNFKEFPHTINEECSSVHMFTWIKHLSILYKMNVLHLKLMLDLIATAILISPAA